VPPGRARCDQPVEQSEGIVVEQESVGIFGLYESRIDAVRQAVADPVLVPMRSSTPQPYRLHRAKADRRRVRGRSRLNPRRQDGPPADTLDVEWPALQ